MIEWIIAGYVFMGVCTFLAFLDEPENWRDVVACLVFGCIWPILIMTHLIKRIRWNG